MKALGVLVLLCIVNYTNADLCGTYPAEEGSPYNITMTFSKISLVNERIRVNHLSVQGSDFDVITCDANKDPPCHDASGSHAYMGQMSISNSSYDLTLTIHNVDRRQDQTTWSWYSSSNRLASCDLPVYSFHSAPVCNGDVQLSGDGNVTWTCRVSHVYPQIKCIFQYRSGISGNFSQVPSDYVNNTVKTTNGEYPVPRTVYNDHTCSLHLPVSQLRDGLDSDNKGSYQFVFTAVLDVAVKGGNKAITKDRGPSTLALLLPQVELIRCPTASDDTGGYIREGTNGTCQCRLKEVGVPQGVAMWRNSSGTDVGDDVGQGVQSLTLTYNPYDESPVYTCIGVSSLGQGSPVKYSPKFSRLLNMTKFEVNSKSHELTVSAGDKVTFMCNVEGKPKPKVTVSGQRSSNEFVLYGTPTTPINIAYMGSEVLKCKDTDRYSCVANNVFDRNVTRTVMVYVQCAPEFPPSHKQQVKEFTPTADGNDLEIRISTIGHPVPRSYTLFRMGHRNVARNNRDEVETKRYNVTYVPGVPPKGDVVLTMFNVTNQDGGLYVLKIDNGIGQGQDYKFKIYSKPVQDDDSSDGDLSLPIGLGVGLSVGLVLCVICVIGIIKVRRRKFLKRKGRKEKKDTDNKETERQRKHSSPRVETHMNQYDPIDFDQEARHVYTTIDGVDDTESGGVRVYQNLKIKSSSVYANTSFSPDENHNSSGTYVNAGTL